MNDRSMDGKARLGCVTIWRALVLAVFGTALMVSVAEAQVRNIATIQGTVTDQSQAVMSGVKVTATSPALLVPEITTTTEKDGTYRFSGVPVGTYRLQYEVSGFQTFIREGVILDVGFAARIDVALSVGSVTQNVVVSGESPVVDTTTTTPAENFTAETLDVLPTTRQVYQMLAMTPGITMAGSTLDVGGSQLGTQQGYKNYGTTGQPTPEIEGINFRQDTDAGGVFVDYYAFQEFQVQAGGMGAEIGLPGAVWTGIVKSGGNSYHGDGIIAYQPGQLQLSNLDPYLQSHGVTGVGNRLNYLYDWFVDLGGKVKRDKLWFYVAYREQNRSQHVANFAEAAVLVPGVGLQSNGVSPLDNHPIGNQTAKITYQMTANQKFIGFFQRNAKNLESETAQSQQAAPFTPFKSGDSLGYAPKVAKLEFQATPRSNFIYSLQFGWEAYNATRLSEPGQDVAGNPSERDLFTGWLGGSYATGQSNSIRFRYQPTANVTYIPNGNHLGKHTFKAGVFIDRVTAGVPRAGKCYSPGSTGLPNCSGNYLLLFNRIGGIAFQPFQIQTFNNPTVGSHGQLRDYSGYIKDEWQVNRHLSLNLGVRIDSYHNFVSASVQPAGQFTAGGSYPKIDTLTWVSAAPRIGVAYDLTGKGKTVLKGSFGWYNWTMGESTFANNFDKDATITYTYTWNGPCVATPYTPCDASPATLASLTPTSSTFVTQTSPGTTLLSPNLPQPRTYEVMAGVEHELKANFAVRALYVYRLESQIFMIVNPARPYSAYSVPVNVKDPGPDGVAGTADDGSTLTLYDYPSAYAGVAFTQSQYQATPSANNSAFHTIQFELNKRMVNRWGMLVSVFALKNHRWLLGTNNAAVVQSPNDLINPIDDTWERDAKLEFTYRLPYGFVFAAFDQIQEGIGLQRTFLFTGIPQQKSLTVRLAPFGQRRLPTINLLNTSVSREFHVFGERRLVVKADVYNALNKNTATSANDASGPSYGFVTSYLPPLVARVGAEFHF